MAVGEERTSWRNDEPESVPRLYAIELEHTEENGVVATDSRPCHQPAVETAFRWAM